MMTTSQPASTLYDSLCVTTNPTKFIESHEPKHRVVKMGEAEADAEADAEARLVNGLRAPFCGPEQLPVQSRNSMSSRVAGEA